MIRDALITSDPLFQPLKSYIIEQTGLAYYLDKDKELAKKIGPRLSALQLGDCASYLSMLRQDQVELDELIGELTIGETFFFRHREQFDALRDVVIPDVIKHKKKGSPLRLWSAACAIGAEPYSLSILLQRDLPHLIAGREISITASDINRKFLASAQRGEFGDWALRSSTDEFKQSCFTNSGNLWRIRDEYRKPVSFQYQYTRDTDSDAHIREGRRSGGPRVGKRRGRFCAEVF